MYEEHSTLSSLDFMKKLILCRPFPIREIQTDNGTEWTKTACRLHQTVEYNTEMLPWIPFSKCCPVGLSATFLSAPKSILHSLFF